MRSRSVVCVCGMMFLLLGTLALVCAPSLLAQTVSETRVYFPKGRPPTEPLRYGNGADKRVVVAVKDAVIVNQPNLDGKPVTQPQYFEPLMAYDEDQDKQYFLIRKLNTEEWGWIRQDAVLANFEPLRDDDASNPAFLKVVVKNNWRTDRGQRIQGAPILNGPGPQYDKVGQVNIFRIRYAYAIQKGEAGRQYVLVGEDPVLNLTAPTSTLAGWIPRDYVILWNNRVGVSYNKETSMQRDQVAFFETQQQLQSYLSTGQLDKALALEDRNVKDPLQYDTTRFPVMDQSHDGQHLKVAFVGDAQNQSTQGIVSQKVIDNERTKIDEVINQSRNRDVLFLIDATKSMGPYFGAVWRGVESYMRSIQQKEERYRFQFALAVYRDYTDDNQGFHLLVNMGGQTIPQLAEEYARSDPKDTDFPEAVFQGIIKGVKDTHWGEGRTRAIVVIGDHGNHEHDRFKEQDVANALVKHRVALYSINVRRYPATIVYNQLFERQLKQIWSLNNDIGKNYALQMLRENAQVDDIRQDLLQTENRVSEILREIFSFSQDVAGALRAKSEGKPTREVETIYGTQVTAYMQRIMQDYGLNDQEINLAKFSQTCLEGWTAKQARNGQRQLEPWVLIERTSMDELVGIVAGLHNLAREQVRQGLGDAVKETVKRASGDPIKANERISEYLQRRYHIPYRETSTTLKYTPEQLEEKFRTSESFKKEFVKTLGRNYALLQSVVEEKTGKLTWVDANQRWIREKAGEKRWWWTTQSGVSFAWIPMEYLP